MSRLETLIALNSSNLDTLSARKYLASALNVIIHLARLLDGSRKIVSIQEITGMEGEIVTLQEIFGFHQVSVNGGGNVRGRFQAKGVRPKWVEKFRALGIPVSYDIFDTSKTFEV